MATMIQKNMTYVCYFHKPPLNFIIALKRIQKLRYYDPELGMRSYPS